MSKAFFLLLITFLISQYDGRICEDITALPAKASDCNDREKGEGIYRCCYLEASGLKMCAPFNKEQYDAIADAIDQYKNQGYNDISIDCGANYIMLSLISLMLLFL